MVWHEKFVESYIFFNLFVLSLIYKDKFVYKKKIPYYKVPQKYKYVYSG